MRPKDRGAHAEHVEPKLDDARLARQWSAVSARLLPPGGGRRWLAGAGALGAVVALAALMLIHPWRSAPARTEGVASGVAGSRQTIALADGSQITLEPDAVLTVERAQPNDIHLLLAKGTVEAEVTHREGRAFVISAAGHDVVVVGTHFRVTTTGAVEGANLRVEVQRGLVRVEGASGTRLLAAGQTWSTTGEARADPPPAPSASPSASNESERTAESGAVKTPAPIETPRELLARATEARAAGRYREAVIALETIRKRHRSDPRAGLAAFELGRMRLDALGDPAGAAEAFADAIALSPQGSWVEDAEARRVEALEGAGAGSRAACEQARAAYLARYPSGIHARSVSQRCHAR